MGALYAGTKTQASLLSSPELGITNQVLTASGTGNTNFETLTFASQTPTVAGAVVIRLISNDTAGNGQAWFDTITRNY